MLPPCRLCVNAGSPPQVRGKHFCPQRNPLSPRITPAGAGKTKSFLRLYMLWQDHPRRCGENLPPKNEHERTPGSPPQVRGKHGKTFMIAVVFRITPAGAGKTALTDKLQSTGEDHPRRCGENSMSLSSRTTKVGSPPQVRGKHRCRRMNRQAIGITPAGAGKTNGMETIISHK